MNDELLKSMWADANKGNAVSFNKDMLAGELDSELKKWNEAITKRNRQEIATAITLMPLFLIAAYISTPILSKIGALLVIPYCCLVIYMLRRAQQFKIVDNTIPTRDFLAGYKYYLEKERALLSNVAYWYILPAMLCMGLYFAGLHKYYALIFMLSFGVVLYYYNKKAVTEQFDPLLERISDELKQMQDDEIQK